jgi:tetratricopeptide (TPR) repeat protein
MRRGKRILHQLALATWFGARAPLALAAFVAAYVQAGLLGAASVAALGLLVRPLRRGWIHVLPVAALAPFVPSAAALLGARLVLGELALQLLGAGAGAGASGDGPGSLRRRRQGVAAVLRPRRALLRRIDVEPATSVVEAERAVAGRRGSDSTGAELELAIVALVGTMVADGRPFALARRVPDLFVMLVAGIYDSEDPGDTDGAIGTAFAKGYIIESAGRVLAGAAVLGPAALAGALLFPADTLTIGPVAISGSIAQGVGILLLGIGVYARSFGLIVVGGLVCWLLTRLHFLDAALIAGGAGAVGRVAAQAVSRFAIEGRSERPRSEPVRGPRRLRLQWRAAASAAEAGRLPIAIDLLEDLASRPKCPAELRARAHSRRARLLFDVGRLEDASAALGLVPADASDDPEHLLALGTVATGVGDLRGAEQHLRAALARLGRRSPLAQRAALTLAQVLSRLDRPDEAIALIAASHGSAWSHGGFARVVEGETAVAGALRRLGQLDRAAIRLDEALEFGTMHEGHEADLSRELRHDLARVEAGARLMAGETALGRGRSREAVEHLKGVPGRVRDGRDDHLLACSQALHGAALIFAGDVEDGVRVTQRGIEALEERRRQLRRADRRTGLILAEGELYEWCFKAFADAAAKGAPGAAAAAAWLIESLRKSAISSMLRDEALKLPATASALADRLSALEQRVNAVAANGTMRSGELDGAEVDADVARLRAELGDALSQEFARSYVPTPTSIDELRALAEQHGDVLSFYLPGGTLPGWRAWISATGEFSVDRVQLDDPPAREVLDELRSGGGPRLFSAVYEPMHRGPAQVWEALGHVLLPAQLRSAIGQGGENGRPRPLLIVPDGVLGLLPWAALQVDGAPLGERCAIELLPSLGLVESREADAGEEPQATALAYFDESLPGHLEEYDALAKHLRVTRARSRREFVDGLERGGEGGAYLATHGLGLGLEQGVAFDDGFLSAGTALLSRWPDWTIFAACLVGRIELTAGHEPLGLPISCVLGGSRSVLAAMVEVPSEEMATFVAPMLAELAQGNDPAHALVCAQRRYLDDHPHASVAECLAFVCVSRAPRRARASRSFDLASSSCEEIAAEAVRVAAEDRTRARELFRSALEVNPDPRLVLHYSGFLAPSEDTRPQARELLERAVADAPRDIDAWRWYAWFLDAHTGEIAQTRAAFERLLALDPENRWAVARFARFLLRRTDDYDAAAAFHKRALRDTPQSATIAVGYGDALQRLGDLPRAREMYERALSLEPDRRYVGGQLAHVVARMGGDAQRVANLFERAVGAEPDDGDRRQSA